MAMPWLSIINAAIFGWLCAGIALRKRHGLHAAMMTLGFGFDLALLVYVEFSSKAIEQTVAKPPGVVLVIHVLLATIMLVLYPFVIYSGGKVLAEATCANTSGWQYRSCWRACWSLSQPGWSRGR
jgi:uncharacterized membrane protein YozB (DUF420 family)